MHSIVDNGWRRHTNDSIKMANFKYKGCFRFFISANLFYSLFLIRFFFFFIETKSNLKSRGYFELKIAAYRTIFSHIYDCECIEHVLYVQGIRYYVFCLLSVRQLDAYHVLMSCHGQEQKKFFFRIHAK